MNCYVCEGHGELMEHSGTELEISTSSSEVCPYCNGTGFIEINE
ncbi:hypothetical protein LC048_10825 [Mesobacillus subterraneus]|nr:hypothetical protein [Mesobacillus subterraneus]WLR57302.1 hypothetical protein LC048_10825 [Mesobacillus subterraneus]